MWFSSFNTSTVKSSTRPESRRINTIARVPTGIYGSTLWQIQPAGQPGFLRRSGRCEAGVCRTVACPRRRLTTNGIDNSNCSTPRRQQLDIVSNNVAKKAMWRKIAVTRTS